MSTATSQYDLNVVGATMQWIWIIVVYFAAFYGTGCDVDYIFVQ